MIADKKTAVERFEVCLECPQLMRPTYSCRECGCFMRIKVKVQRARCPLNKWKEYGMSDDDGDDAIFEESDVETADDYIEPELEVEDADGDYVEDGGAQDGE
jgi:hypothetical protein